MKIGCLINVFCETPFADALSFCKTIGIEMVEIGCGAIPGLQHCDAEALLKDDEAFKKFKATVDRSGLGISAFACHANPVHPVKEIAERFDRIMRSGVLLAEKMGVDTIVTFPAPPAIVRKPLVPTGSHRCSPMMAWQRWTINGTSV